MPDNRQPWSQWIGDDTIDYLYARGMQRWGGKFSGAEDGCIDGALGSAYTAQLYSSEPEQDGYVSGLIFCGYLLFYIATKHCYIDGNKRLAWACAMFVLLAFGLTIEATEDDTVEFCLRISRGDIRSGDQVVIWLSERLVSIT